jgi:hypothetical protein
MPTAAANKTTNPTRSIANTKAKTGVARFDTRAAQQLTVVPPKKRGRQRLHIPSIESRRRVCELRIEHNSYGEIGKAIGCSGDVVREAYAVELAMAAREVMDKIEQRLLKLATAGSNVAASIFVSKCRLGYREDAPPPAAPAPSIRLQLVRPDGTSKPVGYGAAATGEAGGENTATGGKAVQEGPKAPWTSPPTLTPALSPRPTASQS